MSAAIQTTFKVPNFSLPDIGAMALPYIHPLIPASGFIEDDLYAEEAAGIFGPPQSLFIDNSQNGSAFQILFLGSQQRIIIPPAYQAMLPITDPVGNTRFRLTLPAATAAGFVPMFFYNVPFPYAVWPTAALTAAFTPYKVAWANKSGFVAAAGVSQVLAAVNAARTGLMITNPVTAAGQNIAAAESLYINLSGAAGVDDGTSYEITPGGSFFSPSAIPTNQVTVTAATINHRFIASEAS